MERLIKSYFLKICINHKKQRLVISSASCKIMYNRRRAQIIELSTEKLILHYYYILHKLQNKRVDIKGGNDWQICIGGKFTIYIWNIRRKRRIFERRNIG